MDKIVITGGAGFIGSHIAEALAKDYDSISERKIPFGVETP